MPSNPDRTMRLQRTAEAWSLLPHPQALDRRAHALLLLANGHRTLRELSLLVGTNAEPLARQLMQQGLLQDAPAELPSLH